MAVSKWMPYKNRRAILLALTLILLVASFLISQVWASTYVGMNANQGTTPPCAGCGTTPGGTYGIGGVAQAPFAGTVQSVSVYVMTNAPNKVVISAFASQPTQDPCIAFGSCASGGQASTVLDVEGLSGVPTNTFDTVSLANPPSVSANQWIGIVFMTTAGSTASVINICANNPCNPGGVPSNFIAGAQISFATTSPVVGNAYNTVDASVLGINPMITGATFQPSGTTGPTVTVTQCYGNCGNPAVTLALTTASTVFTFNQSITEFYEFQSNLNGFIVNASIPFAQGYAGTSQAGFIGVYTITSCPLGQTPFSNACPGLLQAQFNGGPPPKGRFTMQLSAGSIPVSNGQWVAVAFSCLFGPCKLNDTNTAVPIFQTSGVLPSTISQSSQNTACTCLTGAWLFIRGNVVTGSGASTPSNLSCSGIIDCVIPNIVNGSCSVVTPSCQAGGGVFWIIILTLISIGVLAYTLGQVFPGANLRSFGFGEIAILIFLGWVAIFTSAVPALLYVMVLVFFVVAWMFMGRLKGTGVI